MRRRRLSLNAVDDDGDGDEDDFIRDRKGIARDKVQRNKRSSERPEVTATRRDVLYGT